MADSITWNQLAEIHDHFTGSKARTMPMQVVGKWAKSRADLFHVDEEGFFIPTEKAQAALRGAKE